MKRVLAAIALLLVATTLSFAQGVQTGTIRGTVKDQQGLAVPGVTVTVASAALQGVRSVVTDANGGFTIPNLPPGTYEVTYELSSFATVKNTVNVPLGLVAEQDVTLHAAGVAEQVNVVAEAPAPIATPIVGANYKHEEIEALATPRTLEGIASLAPGLTENTPNSGQVAINGAFAFDNVFMVNGVDVNDNLFGSPQNLFIEDAIQETTVLTSGITAEYGRFSGGVVNAITKSGGNVFSGSLRDNMTNPSWTRPTPFEVGRGTTSRKSNLSQSYEGTFGGPIMKDRLWFFGAGRWSDLSTTTALPETGYSYTQTDKNRRGEIKLTGTVAENHTIQGGYLNNNTENQNRPGLAVSMDQFTLGNRTLPNWFYFTNYRGVLKHNLLAEAQYSQRRFGFRGAGGTSTNIVDSPIVTLGTGRAYNAQYFAANDPENRNNQQLTGNLTYFFSAVGHHEVKGGYEFFRSQRTGGNSQSATDYVFDADYLTANGAPVYDATGHLIPLFVPGETQIEHWLPVVGATLNVDNNSAYVQDHWVVSPRISADVGLRYEKVRSKSTGGIIGIDTDTIVPRLALAYDVTGNGQNVFHVTYAHYSGRYNEAQIGATSPVGNPIGVFGTYIGPAGQGRNFAPGFDPANYTIDTGSFPTANVFLQPGLSSPLTKEFTVSFGREINGQRGFAQATYVHRNMGNLIEDFTTLANGTTHVVQNGVDFGTFTNIVYQNTDLAQRKYEGMLFQGRYNIRNNWTVEGHYTLQLKNEGNYEGEAANQPGATSLIGDYPEAFTAARNFPYGRLAEFQRHKLRAWTIYNFDLGRAGGLSLSGLLRLDSGTTFSYRATRQPLTATQLAAIAAYPDQPTSQTVYFGERGAGQFNGYGVVDTSLNYAIPVFRSVRPWLKFDVFNLFNNQKLITWNTTVRQDPNSPRDAQGLRTGYVLGPNFGKPESNANYPAPYGGLTGGRTFRVAFGFRF